VTTDHNKHILSEIAGKDKEIVRMKSEMDALMEKLRNKIEEVDDY